MSITGQNASIGRLNPFRYKGYYHDTESGMLCCGSRYYVPDWGRCLTQDNADTLDIQNINEVNSGSYCYINPIMNYQIHLGGCGDVVVRDFNTKNESFRKTLNSILSTASFAVGARKELLLMYKYMIAKGTHVKFAYSTFKQLRFPIMEGTVRYFEKSLAFKADFVNIANGSFKQIL